uniref:Uncharacterized protein n=1 Tax=Caenorhabditis japonica TaxID=281687 RepID=A0A8R1E1J8_CAEJA
MVRYLHDGQEIPVTKYKTIGGYLIFMRCYLASLVWDKSITMCEDFRRWLKCSKRRKEVYRQMEHDMKLRKNNLEKSELYLKVKTTKIEVENELSPEGTKADHFPKLTPSIYCCEATV